MVKLKVTIDVNPLRSFRTQVSADIKNPGGEIGSVVMKSWPEHYFEYLRKRYRQNSAGGGDWPALSKRTLEKKVERKGIVRISDTIYNALKPGNPGNMVKKVSGNKGVRLGIGGENVHPGSKLPIGKLAALLSSGNPEKNLPARPIIVAPDTETLTRLRISTQRGFAKFIRKLPKASRKSTVSAFKMGGL